MAKIKQQQQRKQKKKKIMNNLQLDVLRGFESFLNTDFVQKIVNSHKN